MTRRIFKYIERVFNMVRPRKLLFMAIDGVAPRAKMNQQRSRRFKAAREAEERLEAAQKLREEYVIPWRVCLFFVFFSLLCFLSFLS